MPCSQAWEDPGRDGQMCYACTTVMWLGMGDLGLSGNTRSVEGGVQNVRMDRQEFTYLGVIFRDMDMGKLAIR